MGYYGNNQLSMFDLLSKKETHMNTIELIEAVLSNNLNGMEVEVIQRIIKAGEGVPPSSAPTAAPQTDSFYSRYIGQYVIVRSRSEGINAGQVVAADETGIVLKDARRLWYHKPANKSVSWYEGVAIYGLSDDSRVSNAVEEKAIVEDYSISLVSEVAETSIREAKTNEQQ